ncbi:MAG TPA: hypothetical protein VIX80_04920, partial [Candidatus Kapabacteria bacterium]
GVLGRRCKLLTGETKSLRNPTPLTEPPIYPISVTPLRSSLTNKCIDALWMFTATTRHVLFQKVRSRDHNPFLYARHLTHPHPQRIRV